MYRLDPRHLLRALATPHTVHICCDKPMLWTGAVGARGWYCQENPLHVRLG